MNNFEIHSFHIPVMGLGFTVDTPLKVGRFGITSVVSIIEDNLLEQMREYYCRQHSLDYVEIDKQQHDYRARRIGAWLDLLEDLLTRQLHDMRLQEFNETSDLNKYFLLLPESSPLKALYRNMLSEENEETKRFLGNVLRKEVRAGDIEVNIMTKCDRPNNDPEGNPLPPEFSDALSALRGFVRSRGASSVVFSAGMNPRLFTYCESFDDFFPDGQQKLNKKIIIKVSDFRSAQVQGRFLAKKGIWVSEFRIESGLNCGGHAFPTDGLLLGPILQDFAGGREDLLKELFESCNKALHQKQKITFDTMPETKFSVQGGIGTFSEHEFLLEYYKLDSTGWGSPFLLVPEATNVDEATLLDLSNAKQSDYYLSYASPLGLAFNNFRKSSSEQQRKMRMKKNRPGSPCYKKFLSFNTEFTKHAICTASRQYQNLKIQELKKLDLAPEKLTEEIEKVTEKDCLCEGLAASAILKNNILKKGQLKAVAICPGPNLAFFSGVFSLKQMVDHIYGRTSLLNEIPRPNLFINELKLYLDYFQKKVSEKSGKGLETILANLNEGIKYYRELFPLMNRTGSGKSVDDLHLLDELEKKLSEICGAMVVS